MRKIPELTEKDLARFWSRVDIRGPDDCWEWTAGTRRGYGQFSISWSMLDTKCNFSFRANRLSYSIAYGDPGDIDVCHTCDNPLCVNPSHLWLGTSIDNNQDRDNKRRQAKGVQILTSKLTEHQVREILESSGSNKVLSRRYGVTQHTISSIRRGKIWKHLGGKRHTGDSYTNSQTGVRGVSPSRGRYRAIIKRKHIGTFNTINEAKQALEQENS